MSSAIRVLLAFIMANGLTIPVCTAGEIHRQAQTSGRANTASIDCGTMATQGEMNDCFAREAKRTQDLLNSLVQELGKSLEPTEGQQLRQVEAAWTTYRDAHCEWQARFFDGGSVQPTQYSACMAELSWSRIGELKFNLCEGHGMTGPCAASRRYDRPTPARAK